MKTIMERRRHEDMHNSRTDPAGLPKGASYVLADICTLLLTAAPIYAESTGSSSMIMSVTMKQFALKCGPPIKVAAGHFVREIVS